MKSKKIPMRCCVITKERLPKQELIRIVRTPINTVEIDETGKVNGKGAYLKKDIEVINKAKKTKALDRILEVQIEDSMYDELINIIGDNNE